uniref:Adenosine 3'-phospho 5'-phosphosulfate transporter 1 n=1 Tax=Ascaris lumbricoides TaxID=6252 RepID=A0A0M3IP59_ASCLU
EPPHVPPFYKHSFTSISNTLSSWCQYEALKFVSFPTQTVCKASKVLPTMLMGLAIRGERYSRAECASALFLAFGASLFFLANNINNSIRTDHATTLSGICLMFGYLMFDAFTLNWQKTLFDTQPRVSKYQMMFGVNAFSTVLCLVSLIEQGTLISSFTFIISRHHFARDAFLLSLSGAFGQVIALFHIMHEFSLFFASYLPVFLVSYLFALWRGISERCLYLETMGDGLRSCFLVCYTFAHPRHGWNHRNELQVVIYMTIERFGPIVFAIMMTVRQILSIALSAFAYGHPMSPLAILGLIIAFTAIFSNIYRQYFKNYTVRRRSPLNQS